MFKHTFWCRKKKVMCSVASSTDFKAAHFKSTYLSQPKS